MGVRIDPPNDLGLKRPDVEDGENRKENEPAIDLFHRHAGGQNGLPLTKRELYCKWITPTRTTIISDKSTIVLAVSHTVTQPGGYFYTPPDRVTVNFNFDVNRLPGTCYDQTLTGSSKTSSCSVLRNGFILVSYPHVNYEVFGGNMTVD